jgi:hypothetical protein
MHLKFKLDPERITLDQIIGMQDGDLRAMRDTLAACLVNGNGEYMEEEAARREIGSLKLSQVQKAATEFVEQVRDTAVNPQSDGGS